MRKIYYYSGLVVSVVLLIYILDLIFINFNFIVSIFSKPNNANSMMTTSFPMESGAKIVKESTEMSRDRDDIFWVNSGAMFFTQGDLGYSILGDLPTYSPWRFTYLSTNPTDTDDGFHPQNILRIVTKEKVKDFSAQIYFLVVKDNLSNSPNRNESNGLFLMGRYQNANNLYYGGVRVDGTAVIKKKIGGVYKTLAQKKVFLGDSYNRINNPSLLPKNQWFGLRMNVTTTHDQSVKIQVYIDKNSSDIWEKVLEVTDVGVDSKTLMAEGYNGIRSDFMDIAISDFKVIPE